MVHYITFFSIRQAQTGLTHRKRGSVSRDDLRCRMVAFSFSHQCGEDRDGFRVVQNVGCVGVILRPRNLLGHGGDLLIGIGEVHIGQRGNDGGNHVGSGAESLGKGSKADLSHLGGHIPLHKGADEGTAGAAMGNAVPQGDAVAQRMGEAGARHLDGKTAAGGTLKAGEALFLGEACRVAVAWAEIILCQKLPHELAAAEGVFLRCGGGLGGEIGLDAMAEGIKGGADGIIPVQRP